MKGFFDSGDYFCVWTLSDGRTNDRKPLSKTNASRPILVRLVGEEQKYTLKIPRRKKSLYIYADGVPIGSEICLRRPRRAPPSTSGRAAGVHRAERPRPNSATPKSTKSRPRPFSLFSLSPSPAAVIPEARNKQYVYYFSNFPYLHICLGRFSNGRQTEKKTDKKLQ